mgnify:CR=1 FL=1
MFGGKKRFYALVLICIILIALSGSVLYFIRYSRKTKIDYANLTEAWDYVGAHIVDFPFGKLVKVYPTSNVCWLNDAWLVAMALAKLYPDVSSGIMKALNYFNFTDERWCVIFGDVKNFAGPFGMKEEEYGEYNGFEIKAWVSDREQFMPDFANYSDLLALSVMFEHHAGHDWKAKKLYDSLREMWNGIGFVDKISEEEEHFDTYKLALACIAAQLMEDQQIADKLADVIMKNQYTPPDVKQENHQWGFITWYKRLGEPFNPDIPTNVETTTLCLIALSPFIISQPVYSSSIKVGAYYYVWYEKGNNTRHWNDEICDTVIDLPLLDYYNSQDEEVIKQHLDWMEYCGLDFLIVSWWGQIEGGCENSYEDNSTKILFSTVESYASDWMQLAIMVEGFNDTLGPDAYNFTAIYEYLLDTYIRPYSDIYLHVNNKPLVCWFNFERMTGLEANRDAIRRGAYSNGLETRIVGHNNYVDWWFGIPRYDATNTKPKVFVDNEICIEPRYDDQYLGRSKNYTFDPTYERGLYDTEWNEVLSYSRVGSVSLVTIYSWNEFHERSQIEPCIDKISHQGANTRYMLEKTKSYINQLKTLYCP